MNTPTLNSKLIETINLASKYPTIKRVGIFGSYARGDYNSASDIDLLYDYDDESECGTDDILDYVDEIDGIIKNVSMVQSIDYVWYKGVLKSDNETFRQAVLNDVIWIYGN